MYLIFDTETTGLPNNYKAPVHDTENWPRMVQLAWQLHESSGQMIEAINFIIQPEGFDIPFNSTKIHGINFEKANKEGVPLKKVLELFNSALLKSRFIIGHNIDFDIKILGCEFIRKNYKSFFLKKTIIDTQYESVNYCALPGGLGGKFKWPSLNELHTKLFGYPVFEAHNAVNDVKATACCFFELFRLGIISSEQFRINHLRCPINETQTIIPLHSIDISLSKERNIDDKKKYHLRKNKKCIEESGLQRKFAHLHNHTTFSILSATTHIPALIERALKWNMPAVGITDSGNMMGSFYFLNTLEAANTQKAKMDIHPSHSSKPMKGVIGCEVFLSDNYLQKKFTKNQPDRRYKQVFLAKNKKGYQNLSKLCSEGYIHGYYAGYPRIGKDLIVCYKDDLIALTGDLFSEIPYTILNKGESQAKEIFKWWHHLFKDDFYIELLRHGLEEEDHVNDVLLKFSREFGVKYIPQNNSFYLDKQDSNAHDILLCVRDGEKQSTPIGRGRGYRFGFKNQEFFFKKSIDMVMQFSDLPESFHYLEELIGKIETYSLSRKVLLPKFQIPHDFTHSGGSIKNSHNKQDENAYLRYLAYQGAKKRYRVLNQTLKERLEFELETIEKTGYPGYFLIVQDFVSQAKKMDISVGPGRGSVAGSLVAYSTGITNIDPIKYDLLFERFLNPDRISLPDIDMDFDDRGRDRIIEWVVNKYGSKQVAQIITYGSMAAKSAIRDTARVLSLPLSTADYLAKMMLPNMSLKHLLSYTYEELSKNLSGEDLAHAVQLKDIAKLGNAESAVLQQASILEGSIRNTGVHACGLIITPSDITEYIPVTISKESDLLLTQFDNHVVEHAGLLKIDILGLKTLTIIKDTVSLIQKKYGRKFCINQIPLDDEKTYELFQKGDTIAVFQYESVGMQRYMRQLKPDIFDDLIAMNALYRPGPLQYIPNFIARKHGRESIVYDLPEMEEFLKNTYGITVYQEQVMLLAQKLAGFGKGEADILRKSMGKKQKYILDKMKNKFIKGAITRGYPKHVLYKIWQDWEAFASYAFNKSHATCYAYLAFQTAYLKVHYPSEYMASVLSNNMDNIKEVTFFMEECQRIGISVLGPDINDSQHSFSVNQQGAIRFGLKAIKGVGQAASEAILGNRQEKGPYLSIFDFVKRVDLRTANKKTLESLALSGAFDSFKKIHRAQYFHEDHSCSTIAKILHFGAKYQETKKYFQSSLFGETLDMALVEPALPICQPWTNIIKLSKEKEVIGVYISAHPLDDYRHEIFAISGISLEEFSRDEKQWIGKECHIYGIITRSEKKTALKSGNHYGVFTLEDYNGMREFRIFGEAYMKFFHFLGANTFVDIKLSVSRWKDGAIRINFIQIKFLSDVFQDLKKDLYLEINLKNLDRNMIHDIQRTIIKYPGLAKIQVIIIDHQEQVCLWMPSKKYGVHLERNLFSDLDKISGLDFRLK